MGTYKRAPVTLDAVFGFPHREFHGSVASLMGSASRRSITIRIGQKSRYRKVIALLICDRLLYIFHKIHQFRTVGQRRVVQRIGGTRCVCLEILFRLLILSWSICLPMLRNRDFIYFRKASFNGLVIHFQNFCSVFSITFFRCFLHPLFCVPGWKQAGHGKKGSLKNGADFAVQSDFFSNGYGVYYK